MPKVLSKAEIERYWQEGFVFPIRVMAKDEALAYRRHLERFEASTGGPLKGDLRHKSHLLFTWLAELVRHPRLLDAVEDLRIAVDELCYTLMAATDQRLLVRVVVHDGRVIVRGSGRLRVGSPAPSLPNVSELIVDAVSDHYTFDRAGDQLSFVVIKQSRRTVSA